MRSGDKGAFYSIGLLVFVAGAEVHNACELNRILSPVKISSLASQMQ